MKTRFVYQTLEDKDNPDEVENSGPFLCSRKDAWLGEGYYFWESFLNNAHWWGKSTYPNGYIICKAAYVEDEDKCLDLTKAEGIQVFNEVIPLMQAEGIYVPEETTVARIIMYLRQIGHFAWDAAKVAAVNTKQRESEFNTRAIFKSKYPAYIDLCPAIQICFYSKTALQLSGYKIIYPNEYVDGYAV